MLTFAPCQQVCLASQFMSKQLEHWFDCLLALQGHILCISKSWIRADLCLTFVTHVPGINVAVSGALAGVLNSNKTGRGLAYASLEACDLSCVPGWCKGHTAFITVSCHNMFHGHEIFQA